MTTQRASSRQAVPRGLLLSPKMISRRTALGQLVGLVLAGGSITQFATACNSASPSSAPTSHPLGTLLYTYHGHGGDDAAVGAVAWSPDGRYIVSGGNDFTVQVWDAATGKRLMKYSRYSDSVNTVAWSPDGKRIASASTDTTAQVWDASNGGHSYTYRGHLKPVNAVAWSPDGKRIASA